ncbi:MAG TPA: nucleotidyltransferase family protein [Atribacterota bacterium]|nr:nucleotidyltransferase family protein [Atribacterota bacterium]
MIIGIVLAAGEGKRIGKDKVTLPLGSKKVIEWVLDAATKSKLEKIILVVKPEDRETAEAGEKYNTIVVSNPDYKKGMSTSIKKALSELNIQNRYDGFCVLLGDQPFISSDIINSLIEAFQKGKKEIVVPYFQNKPGNPVLFDIAWKEEFMNITGDVGGRILIKAHPDLVKKITLNNEGILFDIDREEDYKKAKARFAKEK